MSAGDVPILNETLSDKVHGRRLQDYIGLYFVPPQDNFPPGGDPINGGPLVLYAGRNYSRWQLVSEEAFTTSGRLRIVDTIFDNSWAIAGRCTLEEWSWPDKIAPLDGSADIPPSDDPLGAAWVAPPQEPLRFMQGVTFKFCWSPLGTFGIADAWIVPDEETIFNVYGALDTCAANGYGPDCLEYRRFFKHAPHVEYEYFLQVDDRQFIFIQELYMNPIIYTRLAYMLGEQCGHTVGEGTLQAATAWQTPVDPLDMIFIGNVRTDMTHGYRNLLCLCPAFDETHELMPNNDGHCEQENDFIQQVGMVYTLMAWFLDVHGVLAQQLVAATRFTIKVDCGNGPYCDTPPHERVKVIDRDWPPVRSDLDNMSWWTSALGPCPDTLETRWWWTPDNCVNQTDASKMSWNCSLDGGTDMSYKHFGTNETRFQPRYESLVNIAQNFDICFVHKPLEVDGIDPATFDPASDDSLQNASRVFWKLGQLIILPLRLKVAKFVMNKEFEVLISTADTTLNNNLQSGALIKVLEQRDRSGFEITPASCKQDRSIESYVLGLICLTASDCTPLAHKGEDHILRLNGGDPNHRLKIKRAGEVAVCYCENYATEEGACEDWNHWILVGKGTVAGPQGTQDFILDVGFIQSFELFGYGFDDFNTVRIVKPGFFCDEFGFDEQDPRVTYCPPWLDGDCLYHGHTANDTHIADIPGYVHRHNSTNPAAVIVSLTQDDNRATVLTFAQIPVLEIGDILHIEDNVVPWAPHWARERDLKEIFRGSDVGHRVDYTLQNGILAGIDMQMDGDLPPYEIDPPEQGRWYRSNKIKIKHIKAAAEAPQMSICWGNEAGSYWAWGGYLTFENPAFMEEIFIGITATMVGAVAPHLLWFKTGPSLEYIEPRNSMQMRIVFTNTSILAPADSSPYGTALEPMYEADQLHEASQAVCGKIFVELWSDHEMGFPVPLGCYVDSNYYGAQGQMQALYMLFNPLNGFAPSTNYKIVMNMQFKHAMSLADYDALDLPLIEVASLDDIVIKPEGIVEVSWINPDKPILEAAGPSDQRFLPHHNGITVGEGVDRYGNTYPPDGNVVIMDDDVELGWSFLIRGDEVGHVRAGAILRFILMPLTIWDLTYASRCKAECTPQEGTMCSGGMSCRYESAMSYCEDIIPPGYNRFIDTREHECEYFEIDGKCAVDGTSYTPDHGISAVQACCACDGGYRYEANIIKMQLPFEMDDALGHQVIHTIRVWNVGQLPQLGFFATRWGVQMTTPQDIKPDWTVTSGKYLARTTVNKLIDPIATLVALEDWGNSRPFKADPLPNDIYLRLQMPFTLFGSVDGFTEIKVILPEGYMCRHVLPAVPREGEGEEAGIEVQLPVLPEESPTGNGALPNSNVTYAGVSSGTWYFENNLCRFVFEPYMVLYMGQRLYLYILANNPMDPLPYTDPRNFWGVNFSSSGHAFYPPNMTKPCEPYNPPACTELGEEYYVNPVGIPPYTQSRDPLFPNASLLSREVGPANATVPTNLTIEPNAEEWYTDAFAVLGILDEVVLQPTSLVWSSPTTFDMWFVPDQGVKRGGSLGIECPIGYQFPSNCNARDLADFHYSTYSPPYGDGSPRIWRMDDMLPCFAEEPNHSAMIPILGAMAPGRLYGLRVDAITVSAYDEDDHGINSRGENGWRFLLTIYGPEGFPLDGTFTEATFFPDDNYTVYKPYDRNIVEDAVTGQPLVYMDQEQMFPTIWTDNMVTVTIGPIVFEGSVLGQLRVIAPDGYEWFYDIDDLEGTFRIENIQPCLNYVGLTRPMPGGAPPLKNVSGRLNIIAWPSYDLYESGVAYCFETLIILPQIPPRKSANVFYLEWGYDEGFVPTAPELGRQAATRVDAPDILTLRDARIEITSTVHADVGLTMWMHVRLMTNISNNGSLQIRFPQTYNMMELDSNINLFQPELSNMFVNAITVDEWGSESLAEDFEMRWVRYEYSLQGGNEYHLVVTCNLTGIPAGLYIFEVNVTTNPSRFYNDPAEGPPCSYLFCAEFFSFKEAPALIWSNTTGWWTEEVVDPSIWPSQNDYYTSIPARFMGRRMELCEIINLTLDERLEVGRNDRPLMRSHLVFAIMLLRYTPQDDDFIRILAPVGWEFDAWCDFYTDSRDIFPINGVPSDYVRFNETYKRVTPWPSSASLRSCRGDNYTAIIRLDAGLVKQRLYMFKIGIKTNPKATPMPYRNSWLVEYGRESSGVVPGFDVWTFTNYFLDPVSLAWTDKVDPQRSPAVLQFQVTNELVPTWMHGRWLYPMIRLIMPAQYEVLVDGDSQDIQGGTCFAQILEVGDCGLCGIPWDQAHINCTREMNRKNVAMVVITHEDGMIHTKPRTYAVAVTIFNPHIMDGKQGEPAPWIVETFLGQPVPFYEAPFGYQLDYTEVPGYKIADRANLTVEYNWDHNGSSEIDPKSFTMTFTELVEVGDLIELRAPRGYEFHIVIPGLYVTTECRNFEWMETVDWPVDIDIRPDFYDYWMPPWRPPLPPEFPFWLETPVYAYNETLFLPIPLNVTNLTIRIEQAEEILVNESMPDWAFEEALGRHLFFNDSGINGSLIIRAHCLSNHTLTSDTSENATVLYWNESQINRTLHPNETYIPDRGFNWTNMTLLQNLTGLTLSLSLVNYTMPGNLTASDVSELNDTNGTNLTNETTQLAFAQFCLSGVWVNYDSMVCINASWNLTLNRTYEIDAHNGSNATHDSNDSNETSLTMMTDECYFAVVEERPELCWKVPVEELPLNSSEVERANSSYEALQEILANGNVTVLAFRVLPVPNRSECKELADLMALGDAQNCTNYTYYNLSNITNISNWSNFTEEELWMMFNETGNVSINITQICENFTLPALPENCTCDEAFGGLYVVEVLWSSTSDLESDADHYAAVYKEQVELRVWDEYPIQVEPWCDGNTILFNITEGSIHPEPGFLNMSTFRFKVGYKNAIQPPLDFENYWLLRHTKNGIISSSDAIESWEIIGQLRYVRVDLLNQVNMPYEHADLHFEFVTVNPLDTLSITALTPDGWDFSEAFIPEMWITSPGHDNVLSRRLQNEVPNVKRGSSASSRRLQRIAEWTTPYTWKGFTPGVTMDPALPTTIVVRFDPKVAREQYVRFRVHMVSLPWTGGQATFDFFGSANNYPQDQLERCCPPGYPPGNPGKVFYVPHRLQGLQYILQNKYQQDGSTYPIAYQFETRFDEMVKATFSFSVPSAIVVPELGEYLLLRIRTPDGYDFASMNYRLEDNYVCLEIPGISGCGRRSHPLDVMYVQSNLTELRLLEMREFSTDLVYYLVFDVDTPVNSTTKNMSSLWVLEITDTVISNYDGLDAASLNLGAVEDSLQLGSVNFSVIADTSPPEVTIIANVSIFSVGEKFLSRIDIYGPFGYYVAFECLAENQDEEVYQSFTSCRDRWALWGRTYLSHAVLQVRAGFVLPLTVKLVVRTPTETPVPNHWYIRCQDADGTVSWGIFEDAFPVIPMFVDVSYSALSNSTVPLFLTVTIRYDLEWGGAIHFAAPRSYRLNCPAQVVSGELEPDCTSSHPVLTGCFGLPLPGEPNPNNMEVCEPDHEMLLTYPEPFYDNTSGLEPPPQYAIEAGTTLLFSIDAYVPVETPEFIENVFRVRILDSASIPVDGNLNTRGNTVREEPQVGDFGLWWQSSNPGVRVTVAVEFNFGSTIVRGSEDPDAILRVIEIELPEGLTMGVQYPWDVFSVTDDTRVPVTEWNWTTALPRMLFFGLDDNKNVSGKFHYAFPVILPRESVGMPMSNLWIVNLCTDAPYCSTLILSVPMVGFDFYDPSPFDLDIEAARGSGAFRRSTPAYFWALLVMGVSCVMPAASAEAG